MRRLTLLLLFVVTTINMMCAQVPQGFTYQAIVRNNDGTTIANSQVSVRIELVHGSANGTVQYAENHSPLTDANGLFTIVIGDGVPLVNCLFSDCINWAVGPWFLTTRIDPTGGNSYTLVTTQQLMSVPYALYAANAGSAVQIRDSVVVYIRDSIVYDTIDTYSYDSHPSDVIGALPGVFSISPANRICFSKGNLQYKACTNTWRFAEHQWDMVGTANMYISAEDTLWIDLFGYGASGYSQKYPYMHSTSSSSYPIVPISTTGYDWGVNNAISNGGDSAGLWRTLTSSEWYYILQQRTNAVSLRALATVAGMPGVILLPDNWTAVPNIGINHEASNYVTNIYNVTQWNILQNNGAVFLPAAGEREDNTISNVGIKCCYWSSSYSTSSGAYRFHTDVPSSMPYKFNHINNYIGCSVRLIHDITELP